MVREVSDHNATQEEMDNNQYLKNGILRYQRVFGYTFVSTGGKQTTEVCKKFEIIQDFENSSKMAKNYGKKMKKNLTHFFRRFFKNQIFHNT